MLISKYLQYKLYQESLGSTIIKKEYPNNGIILILTSPAATLRCQLQWPNLFHIQQ